MFSTLLLIRLISSLDLPDVVNSDVPLVAAGGVGVQAAAGHVVALEDQHPLAGTYEVRLPKCLSFFKKIWLVFGCIGTAFSKECATFF